MKMSMSEKGKELLVQWEGLSLSVYYDSAGLPTIGVGHLLTKTERSSGRIDAGESGMRIKYRNGITEEQAYDLLAHDLRRFEWNVNRVKVPLEQHQFDALVSFSFNVGVGAFNASTLLRRLNAGKYEDVPAQLRRWVYSAGKKIRGLVNRREREVDLWSGLL